MADDRSPADDEQFWSGPEDYAVELHGAEQPQAPIPLKYTELIESTLQAITGDDRDTEMELRAELMNRFRIPAGQVEADLLRHHMLLETAGEKKKAPPESLDLDQVEGMDFLIDGYIPANDQTLLWGKAGTGKTTAAVGWVRSVLFGEGFLDHPHPAERGSVLFIASDSGPGPLKSVLQSAGIIDHPVFKNGPEKRFHLWASDREQGMSAWTADLPGCIRLLDFIKRKGIDLVIIDSCKSVTVQSTISYGDNKQVGALMTYFKEVICAHTTVVWLSHDGTQGADSNAGAKMWKEVPSMVHRLEYDIDPKTKEIAKDYRKWVVQKNRLGRCREFYFEEDSGDLKLRANQQVFPNCTAAIVEVLMACFLEGQEEVSRGQIVASVDATGKTVDNCLSKAVKAKHPEICRCNRGKYKLAPRLQEGLKGVRVDREEVSEKPLSDCDVSTSRQVPDGNFGNSQLFPRENIGKSPEASGCNGSGASFPDRGKGLIGELPVEGSELVELKRVGSGYDVEAS